MSFRRNKDNNLFFSYFVANTEFFQNLHKRIRQSCARVAHRYFNDVQQVGYCLTVHFVVNYDCNQSSVIRRGPRIHLKA